MPTRVEHVGPMDVVNWQAVARGEVRAVVGLPHCQVVVVSLADLDRLEQLDLFLRTSEELYRPDRGLRCLECRNERLRRALAAKLGREELHQTPGCSMCLAASTKGRL